MLRDQNSMLTNRVNELEEEKVEFQTKIQSLNIEIAMLNEMNIDLKAKADDFEYKLNNETKMRGDQFCIFEKKLSDEKV